MSKFFLPVMTSCFCILLGDPLSFGMCSGNGNKDGLFSVLLRDYKAEAAAACMNRLAKLR